MNFRSIVLATLAALAPVAQLMATSPVSPPASTTGVPAGDIKRFASEVVSYAPAPRAETNDNTANALGAADGVTVSLGDLTSEELLAGDLPGVIVVEFRDQIFNGPGADLAVFENASNFGFFDDPFTFAELAFVEVSSNGADFARFPAVSLNILPDDLMDEPNELLAPFGLDFAGLNTTFVRNLAGVHETGFGTPFDLDELSGDPLVVSGAVDLNAIQFIRLIDIPGTGDVLDSTGNPIFDTQVSLAFPTLQGFDLDAVGAINVTPEPSSMLLAIWLALGGLSVGRLPRRR